MIGLILAFIGFVWCLSLNKDFVVPTPVGVVIGFILLLLGLQ